MMVYAGISHSSHLRRRPNSDTLPIAAASNRGSEGPEEIPDRGEELLPKDLGSDMSVALRQADDRGLGKDVPENGKKFFPI